MIRIIFFAVVAGAGGAAGWALVGQFGWLGLLPCAVVGLVMGRGAAVIAGDES